MSKLKDWLVAVFFAVGMSLSGCTSLITGTTNYADLSPAQIKQLQEMQMDVYSCVTIAGPPPTGRTVMIAVPRLDKKPDVRFGENCAIR